MMPLLTKQVSSNHQEEKLLEANFPQRLGAFPTAAAVCYMADEDFQGFQASWPGWLGNDR